MNKRRTKRVVTLLVGIATITLAYAQQHNIIKPAAKVAEQNQPGLYKVIEFVDGDTIAVEMDGTKEKVRLIGVDTPETHDPRKAVQCFGQAAADFTKRTIGSNRVRLEADQQNTNRDRYSRLLRYVYLPEGTLLNAELIKQGYGFAYTHFPFTKLDEFRAYEKTARESNKGLWGNCTPEIDSKGQIHSNDAI